MQIWVIPLPIRRLSHIVLHNFLCATQNSKTNHHTFATTLGEIFVKPSSVSWMLQDTLKLTLIHRYALFPFISDYRHISFRVRFIIHMEICLKFFNIFLYWVNWRSQCFLKFLYRNISKPSFQPVLLDVADLLLGKVCLWFCFFINVQTTCVSRDDHVR